MWGKAVVARIAGCRCGMGLAAGVADDKLPGQARAEDVLLLPLHICFGMLRFLSDQVKTNPHLIRASSLGPI